MLCEFRVSERSIAKGVSSRVVEILREVIEPRHEDELGDLVDVTPSARSGLSVRWSRGPEPDDSRANNRDSSIHLPPVIAYPFTRHEVVTVILAEVTREAACAIAARELAHRLENLRDELTPFEDADAIRELMGDELVRVLACDQSALRAAREAKRKADAREAIRRKRGQPSSESSTRIAESIAPAYCHPAIGSNANAPKMTAAMAAALLGVSDSAIRQWLKLETTGLRALLQPLHDMGLIPTPLCSQVFQGSPRPVRRSFSLFAGFSG